MTKRKKLPQHNSDTGRKGREAARLNAEATRAEAPSPNNALPASWQPFALVLIVDERDCVCGAHYTCPNTQLMLETVNRRGDTRMISVSPRDLSELTVPRILRTVYSESSTCPACFHPEPNGRPAKPMHTAELDRLTPAPVKRGISLEELIS